MKEHQEDVTRKYKITGTVYLVPLFVESMVQQAHLDPECFRVTLSGSAKLRSFPTFQYLLDSINQVQYNVTKIKIQLHCSDNGITKFQPLVERWEGST